MHGRSAHSPCRPRALHRYGFDLVQEGCKAAVCYSCCGAMRYGSALQALWQDGLNRFLLAKSPDLHRCPCLAMTASATPEWTRVHVACSSPTQQNMASCRTRARGRAGGGGRSRDGCAAGCQLPPAAHARVFQAGDREVSSGLTTVACVGTAEQAASPIAHPYHI